MSSSSGQPISQERENGDSENQEIIHGSAVSQSACYVNPRRSRGRKSIKPSVASL